MEFIKTFEAFIKKNWEEQKKLRNPKKDLGEVKRVVQIRIDVQSVEHVYKDRQFRHEEPIEDGDITDTVKAAIEELTIALMQDKFDIIQYRDDYPTKGVKAGQPARFIIHDIDDDLNIVCILEPGDEEFTLTVITVMREADFSHPDDTYVIEISKREELKKIK